MPLPFRSSERTLRSTARLLQLALFAATASSLTVWSVPSSVAAGRKDRAEEQEEEVDLLALGARLVADGHDDRAEIVLKQVDPQDEKVDRPKLHFLLGTIYLKQQSYRHAREQLLASIRAGQPSRGIYLYLAQAEFQLKNYAQVIAALDKAGAAARDNPGAYAMRAESHFLLKQHDRAIATLNAGIQRHPDFTKLTQMKLGYLMELGLYQEVVQVGERYLSLPGAGADDHAAIAEGLRKSGQLGAARLIMEQARLRYPGEESAIVQLANVYNDLRRPLSAAMLFEEAARRVDPKYYFEAAELYKEAGRLSRALLLNARILEPNQKLKQRLAILLQMESFELMAAMEPSLSRAGLLKDENIRYALAYGYFKNGDFGTAEQHLKRLSEPSLFEKATALRKAMATCREAGWACY